MLRSIRLAATRSDPLDITFNGAPIRCYGGETVATALLANGINEFGSTQEGDPKQVLCNMGSCFDCVVTIDRTPLIRACLTYAAQGMDVQSTKFA